MSETAGLVPDKKLQLKEIQNAICEADAGDFSTHQEVIAVMNKWKLKSLEIGKAQDK